MSFESLIFMPNHPTLSVLIWAGGLVILLYLARIPAHHLLKSLSRAVYSAMRLGSRSIQSAIRHLQQRNREVLLAAGAETVERLTEREFNRVHAVVKQNLQEYPALHRTMADLTNRIDEDYKQSAEVPPSPAGWVNAVDSISKITSMGDSLTAKIMGEIKKGLDQDHKKAMDEYRKSGKRRHELLNKMMPYWRNLVQAMEKTGKTITGLQDRSSVIDKRMTEYEGILAKTDKAERILSSSSLVQFAVSGLVLLIAIGGAVVNFNLIALPMSEMVGGGSYIGPFKTSHIAALVIILVETAMGLYLMESLRITRLFPVIATMDDKLRHRMIYVTLTILIILAGIESALAFMRDLIAADMQALRQSLAGVENAEASSRLIPTIGQMVMGFILPFALAFVAIPLESFVHSARTVLGLFLIGFLSILSFLLRLIGNIVRYTGELLIKIYDLIIFPLIWVERLVRGKEQCKIATTKEGAK